MKASAEYISVGANRSSSCAVCSAKGEVAFGAGRYVALWDSESSSRGVKRTLKGHAGQVTTVKSLEEGSGPYQLVSGDSVGEVRLWTTDNDNDQYSSSSIQAHKGSISALGVPTASGPLDGHILTGGSDGLIKLWDLSAGKPEVKQTIDLKGKLPLDLQVASLPGSSAPILIAGLTDRRIRIYTFTNGQFVHALSLEGHEDWVRCLSITPYPSSSSGSTDLLLASGSQDNYIRLWRISRINGRDADETVNQGDGGLDMLDEFERKLAGEAGGSVQISTKAHVLSVDSEDGPSRYNITLEALLMGHEAGVTNIRWSPSSTDPLLLSTSSDNSIILWTPSSNSTAKDGIWVPEQRFGATGGRGLGFHGPMWSTDGKSIMATGWNGGLERWTEVDNGVWEPRSGLSGHFGSVESCVWAPNGDYLLSVGADQTSRMHAPTSVDSHALWAEIARPQIHGYDMTDAAFISPYRFASTGDEKVTRVFDAPGGFVDSLQALGVSTSTQDTSSRPKGATVPPLGLSNRALGKAAEVSDVPVPHVANPAIDSVSKAFTALPTEEELSTTTLWPEVEKVYGHGYELVTIAASHEGKLIATACRASNADHAVVRIQSTETWDAVGEPLAGHSLSITRIAFSPDDTLILTCSRDRGWRLFSMKSNPAEGFEPMARDERAHSRMVLDCCWSPDGSFFATASRDKSVKLWKQNPNQEWTAVCTLKMTESATAVDITSTPNGPLLAIGTESGVISLHAVEVKEDNLETKLVHEIESSHGHCSTVNRLAFRPAKDGVMLASSSDDRSLRLFTLIQ